jgi:hypothetical protein
LICKIGGCYFIGLSACKRRRLCVIVAGSGYRKAGD